MLGILLSVSIGGALVGRDMVPIQKASCRMSAASCKRLEELIESQEMLGEWDPRPHPVDWNRNGYYGVSYPLPYGSYSTEAKP